MFAGWVFEISSISNYDFICLVATYNDLTDGERHKVSTTVANRGYTPEQLAHVSKRISDTFSPITSCGLKFTKPFEHLKYGPIAYLLTLFENYERGVLPSEGGSSDQSAQIMELFSVLRQLKHEFEIKIRENQKSNGRNQHKNKPRTR